MAVVNWKIGSGASRRRYGSYIEINSGPDYAEKLEQDMEMDALRTGINACSLPLQDSVCGIRLD